MVGFDLEGRSKMLPPAVVLIGVVLVLVSSWLLRAR